MQLVTSALTHSNLDVLRAYVDNLNPGMWLAVSRRTRSPARNKALHELARLSESLGRHDQLARLIRRLQVDDLSLGRQLKPDTGPRRERLTLLHAVRVAVIQRIRLLATEIPNFSPQHGVARDDVLASIVALDVKTTVDCLARIFPVQRAADREQEDFGEQSSYRPEPKLSYAVEHDALFGPLLRLSELARSIGSAITYEIGAVG